MADLRGKLASSVYRVSGSARPRRLVTRTPSHATRDHCQRGVSDHGLAAALAADAVQTRGRSRHVSAFERVVIHGASAGGKERRPLAVLDNSHRLRQLWRGLCASGRQTNRAGSLRQGP